MFVVGVDIGSVASKAVVFDGEMKSYAVLPTGWSPQTAGAAVMQQALHNAGVVQEEVQCIVCTGYGRKTLPLADQRVTEITCHGRGVHYLYPAAQTIIDVGGQDSKVIRLDPQGSVIDFLMNDKCAAGTGRFLQTLSGVLGVEVGDLAALSAGVEPLPISSMCTVFAESEVVGLLAKGALKEQIAAGILQSIASRIAGMASRVGLEPELVFTGGTACNSELTYLLAKALGHSVQVPLQPQLTGALGAAIIAWHSISR